MSLTDFSDLTAPQPCAAPPRNRTFSIGLPRCDNPTERRFPLTPEAVEMLTERGFTVKMESDAAKSIHYSDNAYTRHGAKIVPRDEALICDIVIHLSPLNKRDIMKMRRGAMLLTLLNLEILSEETVKEYLSHGIITIAIDLIADDNGNHPFADILAEIDGRASVAIASSLLADSVHGKGILLGGVAGLIPCEVMIVGSGLAAVSAARSATGLGAIVNMFDNDVYRLRSAIRELGPQIVGSAFHPKVVNKALASADVLIVTETSNSFSFSAEQVSAMKKGVISFDLSSQYGKAFPAMTTVDLSMARADDNTSEGQRVCYTHAGSAVPRTAAMALSTTFITMLDDILTLEGVTNALKLSPGLQVAACTFLGKVVNPAVARKFSMRHVDISLFLQFS